MPLPTVILPGYLENAFAYLSLQSSLQDLGFPTTTVALRRRDWFATVGGRSVNPILQQLDYTVKQVLQHYNTEQINLIGHSAGGWISRIYLGEKPYIKKGKAKSYVWNANSQIATLVTLGTPHTSNERWTRHNLDFVNHNYPGAFHLNVRYVCVAGKTIFGQKWGKNWLAYSSYQLTGGKGDTWGDGIVPVEAAHLPGAENLTIDGVMHSPRTAKIWYGSPAALKLWRHFLV